MSTRHQEMLVAKFEFLCEGYGQKDLSLTLEMTT